MLDVKSLQFVAQRGEEGVYKCPKIHETGLPLDKSGHLYVNKAKGVYYCFKCGTGGHLEGGGTISIKEISDLLLQPEVLTPGSSAGSCASSMQVALESKKPRTISFRSAELRVKHALGEFLKEHNLIFPEVEPFGLEYFSTHDGKSGAIYIPFYNEKNSLTFYTFRFIIGEYKTRHVFPKGFGPAPLYLNTWNYKEEPLFLVEGVFDALRLSVLGYAAIALCGKRINPLQLGALLSLKLKPTRIIVLLDGDALLNSIDLVNILKSLLPASCPVRACLLGEGQDPAAVGDTELHTLLRRFYD